MNYQILENELQVFVDKNIYHEDVLFKCFYWYGKDFSVEISTKHVDGYLIKLNPIEKKILDNEEWIVITNKIKQDLIDFKLRDIVTKETKIVRELIIAKAFAYYEPSQDPTTKISDPVGFSPNQ